jgi:O-antigen ligase
MFSMIWGGRLVSVFILWAIATNFWTDDLAVSFRRTILVYLSLSVTWYMLETYTVDTLIRMFARVMLFLMLCSAFVSTFLPSLGHVLKDYPGAWTGIFSHKNTLGSLCQLAVLGEGYLIQADRKHRVWRALIIAFYLFVAVMCQSKTGLITSILTLAFYVFLRLLLLPGMLRVWATYLIAAGSTIGGLLVFFNFTAIMTAIGRDPTLSGRIQVWESLIRVTRHPFAGYGYAAFWSSKNPDVGRVWADVGWPVPEAHDAYLDLFLNVGLVGLIITMVTFWLSFRILLRMHLEGKYEWTSYFLAYLTSYFFSNIVETKMYFPFDMTTLLFILAYFATLKFGMVPNTHPALIRRGARVFGGMKQRSRLDQRPAIDLLDPPPGKVPA